jgi:multicomponent Na+:H+ antiporter subunit E
MTYVTLTLLLALGWGAATGSFALANLVFGALVAAGALFFVRERVERPGGLRRLRQLAGLAWLFLVELLVSAVRVAVLVMRPDMQRHLAPGIVAFPLSVTTDAEITLLANLITLTPGTLSVDVSEDRRVLYVHAIALKDREQAIADIANGFEARIREAFR